MATLIKENGEKIIITPGNGKQFELEELQKYVGGYIEIVQLWHDDVLVLDEEGKLKSKEINSTATALAHLNRAIFPYDCIVGDVVLCKIHEV